MVDTHEHDEHEHEHEHGPVPFTPQPVQMGIAADLGVMDDGTDRVIVTFTSVNGSWTVFFDREGAIAHAQRLLGLAHRPPEPGPTSDEQVPAPIA